MILREGDEVCIVQCAQKKLTRNPCLGIPSTSKPSAVDDDLLFSVCALVEGQKIIVIVKLKVC